MNGWANTDVKVLKASKEWSTSKETTKNYRKKCNLHGYVLLVDMKNKLTKYPKKEHGPHLSISEIWIFNSQGKKNTEHSKIGRKTQFHRAELKFF